MSIIHDALKKTQENLNQKDPKAEDISKIYEKLKKPGVDHKSPPPSFKKDDKKKTEERSSNPFIGILILILLVAGIFFVYQYFYGGKKGKMAFKQFKFEIPKQRSTPQQVKPREYGVEEIVLNGIVAANERKAALINGKIYEIGEEIKGKKVINITVDKVELMDTTGAVTTLKTEK